MWRNGEVKKERKRGDNSVGIEESAFAFCRRLEGMGVAVAVRRNTETDILFVSTEELINESD